MMHAIPYICLGTLYLAMKLGIDKSVVETLVSATYYLTGLAVIAAHAKTLRVGRWVGLLGLVMAFQAVEVGCAVSGENRPPIVMSAAVSPRAERAG